MDAVGRLLAAVVAVGVGVELVVGFGVAVNVISICRFFRALGSFFCCDDVGCCLSTSIGVSMTTRLVAVEVAKGPAAFFSVQTLIQR